MSLTIEQEIPDTMRLASLPFDSEPNPIFSVGTVMVISQNEVELHRLAQYLEEAGYLVMTARDKQTVGRHLSNIQPDAIIIHTADALDLCREIKQLPHGHDIAVFVVLESTDYTGIEAALDAGMTDYMPLPLHLPMLRHRLEQCIKTARTRQSMEEYARDLEARNEELAAYSYTIAHDLKQPLNFISTLAGLLEVDELDTLSSDSVETLTKIQQQTVRMGRMIDQMLWLAQIKHVNQIAHKVDMEDVVATALERFEHLIQANHVSLEIAGDLPPIMGHAQLIEEVLANLISNAVKYMGSSAQRQIIIRAQQMGPQVRYEVADTGIGISHRDQARLFRMFSRIHAQRDSGTGLGLGLAIVQRIITRLGGQVGVESQPGCGSTFWFTLPSA